MLTLGSLALNTSMCIYVTNWLPQVWRTFNQRKIHDLSQIMVVLIVIGWSADLLYGRAYSMPYQYIFVSFLGCAQTFLWVMLLAKRAFLSTTLLYAYVALITMAVLFPESHMTLIKTMPILTVAQSAFWVSMLAQVYKSFKRKSARDISLLTYSMNTVGCMCSAIAAHQLGWEHQYFVNLVGMTLFHVVVFSILFYYRLKTS